MYTFIELRIYKNKISVNTTIFIFQNLFLVTALLRIILEVSSSVHGIRQYLGFKIKLFR